MRRVVLLALALGACSTDAPDAPASDVLAPETPGTAGFAATLNVDLEASTRTPSGIFFRDLTVGTGDEALPGRVVAVLYTGWLTDGTVFDGNMPAGPTLPFTVGVGEVIPGWDEGVAGMRVGGRRQIVVPPELGYGAAGRGPIPPNATLVFEVELAGVQGLSSPPVSPPQPGG